MLGLATGRIMEHVYKHLALLHREDGLEKPLENDLTLNRVLVPLDGSILAEQALFSARLLAHEFEARLCFLMVEQSQSKDSDSPLPGTDLHPAPPG